MKAYKYLSISTRVRGYSVAIWLESTDSQVLNWILAEVRKFYPSSWMKQRDKLPSGEVYSVEISKLKDDDCAVHWWIVKQLCLQGWEPFAAPDVHDGYIHHLRLGVTNNG
jgi:hypothetical protein